MVGALRASAPYIHAHHGRTFVVNFGGEAAGAPGFEALVYDIALLHSLGVRLVLVHGARPQIDAALAGAGIDTRMVAGVRVTDVEALACVKRAVGSLRMDIEALLSTGLASTPMGGARLRVAGGNLVTAKPVGVAHGVDHQHTGEVRRVDVDAIRTHLDRGHIVLLSPIGYSPTGEIFNLFHEEVATATAAALRADKLVLLHAGAELHDRRTDLPAQLGLHEAEALLADEGALETADRTRLEAAVQACRQGVTRAHLVSFEDDGALLRELYSRDGVGTLIAADTYDTVRQATAEDAGGLLALIQPLEAAGVLVPRSREQLELEIDQYTVLVRDGLITACCALMPYTEESVGELACVAVHPDYRRQGRAELLLRSVEKRARALGLRRLFILTTKAGHWFVEHGFEPGDLADLPLSKRQLYNYQRNSAVYIKAL
ncbi:amino-acid N-acetyltransferase [Salinisphaera sp. PC39]|uniref:amino-acid N-acetyltransferase n=1 Tax=Salinisphaera sp. PC39 TaxID=1304156 RepID=UPI0033414922